MLAAECDIMISVIGIMRFTTLLNIGLNDKNRQSKRYAKNTQEYVRRVTARGQRLKREAGSGNSARVRRRPGKGTMKFG